MSAGTDYRPRPQAISTPLIAWIQTNGNNSTGAVGNPGRPYLTAQAAWNAGARHLKFGTGSFGALVINDDAIFIEGHGTTQSIIAALTTTATGINVTDVKGKSVKISGINGAGDNGVGDAAGSDGKAIIANGCYVDGGVSAEGGAGSDATGTAFPGGLGGSITLQDCDVDGPVNADGGAGSIAGAGNSNAGGDGGDAFFVSVTDCRVAGDITCRGGLGGDSPNGAGGNGGDGGTLTMIRTFGITCSAEGGAEGTGGSGNGVAGNAGTATARELDANSLTPQTTVLASIIGDTFITS